VIHLNLVVEDLLSEAIARRLLSIAEDRMVVATVKIAGGYGEIGKRISAYNRAAKAVPFFILADLDRDKGACAPQLRKAWLPHGTNPLLLFRIAVPQVEAWLLADQEGVATFLGIAPDLVPLAPEALPDPKATLIKLAKHSPKAFLRRALLPAPGSDARLGPGYNIQLSRFAQSTWNLSRARRASVSLDRAIKALDRFP
jgi:hypothetical protein